MSAARIRHHGLKKRCSCPSKDWSRCPHPWHFGFHWQGREYRYSLHAVAKRARDYVMPKSEAHALADKLRTAIRAGQHPSQQAPEAAAAPATRTFSDVASDYLKRHVWSPTRREAAAQSIANYVKILERLEIPVTENLTASLGSRAFATITKPDLEAARDARRAELARTDANARVRPGCKGAKSGSST